MKKCDQKLPIGRPGHGRLTLELVLVRQNVTAKWCRNVPSDGFQYW